MNGSKRIKVALLAVMFQFSFSQGNIALGSVSDLTGQYDCNLGEKVAELDDPSHPVIPYYEIYNNGETVTVRSGSGCTEVVNIPIGVHEIDDNAFKDSDVTEIILPNTVRSIGTQAFKGSLLAKINLPAGITTISNSSFRNSKLTEITIPNSVAIIEGEAFFGISELVTVTFGAGLKTIGAYAFAQTAIVNLRLPPLVETVGTNAFADASLVHIFIPQSVTTINDHAFASNYELLSLSVTDSVTSLANNAFAFLNMALVDTSYCGTLYLDLDSKFYGSSVTCRSPSNITVSTTVSNANKSITFNVGKTINHGGAPISKFDLLNTDEEVIQTLEYTSEPVFFLSNQPTGKNLRFKVRAENSAGLATLSSFTDVIVFRTQTEESEESRRQAEIKRQREITKFREASLSKLKSGGQLTLDDFNKSGLDGVNSDNFYRVQSRIKKTLDSSNPKVEEIEKAIKHVETVDSVCLKEVVPVNIWAQNLVQIGLIPAESKNKTQIWYQIKNSPRAARQDEISLIDLIGQIQVTIHDRMKRLDQLKARMAARKGTL